MKGAKRKRTESENEPSKIEINGKKQPDRSKATKTNNTKKQKSQSTTDTAASSRSKRRCVKNTDMNYNELDDIESSESKSDYSSEEFESSEFDVRDEGLSKRPLKKSMQTSANCRKRRENTLMIKPKHGVNQRNLKAWERDAPIRQPAEFKEVFNGTCKSRLVAFNDMQIFKAQSSGDPNADCVEATVLVDVPGLKYKMQVGELGYQDVQNLLALIKTTNKISCNMEQFKPQCLPSQRAGASECKLPAEFAMQLKHYQQASVMWMRRVEEIVDAGTGWSISYLVPLTSNGSSMYLDMRWERVVLPPTSNDQTNSLTLRSKGGFLADEMGLGKTVTLLALLVSHKMPEPRIPMPSDVRWGNGVLLPTGATLLVAPSHLTSQWKDEAAKCMPSLSVIVITTKPQFDKVTYADIMLADLVVVSVQFLLTNKCYTTLPHGHSAVRSLHLLLGQLGRNPLLSNSPNLCHFHWWRFVCDEAHEILKYEPGKRHAYKRQQSHGLTAVQQISSVYRWYMTGTPFPNGIDSLRGALKFIGATVDDLSLMHDDNSLRVDEDCHSAEQQLLYKLVHSNLFVRNTKESAGREYNVPEYVEELMLLTMSEVERAIYDRAISEQEKRQLCCHMQLGRRMQIIMGSEQRTLDEVKVMMIAHLKDEIKSFQGQLTVLQKDIENRKKNVNALNLCDSKRKADIEREERMITQNQESIAAHKQSITECETTMTYLESLQPRVEQQVDEPCAICLDEIKSLTLVPCGHFFCKACITQCVQQHGVCPLCRKPIAANQLYEIVDEKAKNKMEKMTELRNLIELFGTKMAYLIFYLRYLFRELPESRVIVFSQWDDMLVKVGKTLSDNGIKNVFVKGNVYVRNKAISAFKKQKKTRVIMLSLDHAASGTNLIEASHVVLIDPVAENKEKAVAVENQAIGRAHRMGQDKQIKVIRLVMKDTIEYDLYTRNYSDNIIDHVEMQFDSLENYGVQVISTVKKVSALAVDQRNGNDHIDDQDQAGPSRCAATFGGCAASGDDSEISSDNDDDCN